MARKTATQPTLPRFAGRIPDGQTLKMTGSTPLPPAMLDGHDLEDVLYLVVGVRVAKVGHEIDGDGHVTRVETCKTLNLALLEEIEGEKLLARKLTDAGVTLDV